MADRTVTRLFEDSADFTFNTSLVEVTSYRGALKNQTPTSVTFYAPYTVDEDAAYSSGDGSGTLVGGATVSSDELNCTGLSGKYCTYDAEDNANHAQILCIRIRFKTGYTGVPASTSHIININKGDGSLNNLLQVYQQSSGVLSYGLYDNSGSPIFNINVAGWSPTAGTPNEFELNIDITNGATRFFIDGTQQGATNTSTGIRNSANINELALGSNHTHAVFGDYSYMDVLVFDSIQHTSNYTPDWSDIPATRYTTTVPKIYRSSGLRHQGITSITPITSLSGSDLVYCTLTKNGTEYYYDTVNEEWAVTTGYPDVNTIAEINANLSTFVTDGLGVLSYINWYLYSADGSTTPAITSYTVVYDFYGAAIDDASLCTVYGYVRDNNTAIQNANVIIIPSRSIALYNDDSGEILQSYTHLTDANGYFEQDLPVSTNMDITYSIVIHYIDSNNKKYHREYNNIIIPNEDNVNYATLI